MASPRFRYLKTDVQEDVLVATLTPARLEGDEMASQILKELQAALEHTGLNKLVVNLEHVVFFPSPHFRPLLVLRKQFQTTNGRMILSTLDENVLGSFRVMRMLGSSESPAGLFEVADDVDAALARFASAPQPAPVAPVPQ